MRTTSTRIVSGSFKRPSNKKCSIEGCGKPYEARGWCTSHYDRWRNHGDPLYQRKEWGMRAWLLSLPPETPVPLPDHLRLQRNLTRNIHHAAAAASLRIQVRNKQDGDCLVTVLDD